MEDGESGDCLDDLVLYGESEDDLRAMVGRFAEMCRRGVKVSAR